MQSNLPAVKFLVDKHKADIDNASNTEGWSPLMYAVMKGAHEVVKFLLERGARLDVRDEDSFTALLIAADRGELAMFRCLIESSGDYYLREIDAICDIVKQNVQ